MKVAYTGFSIDDVWQKIESSTEAVSLIDSNIITGHFVSQKSSFLAFEEFVQRRVAAGFEGKIEELCGKHPAPPDKALLL